MALIAGHRQGPDRHRQHHRSISGHAFPKTKDNPLHRGGTSRSIVALGQTAADACTRLVYLGPDDDVITARSMDWKNDIQTNLWVLPRGAERNGEAGPNSIRWTSEYGSVVATG